MTAVPVFFAGTDGIFAVCQRSYTRTICSAEALLFYFQSLAYARDDSRIVRENVFRLFHWFFVIGRILKDPPQI